MTEKAPYSLDDLVSELELDDSVHSRLEAYGDLLVKWQKRINLVGPRTIEDRWQRHFLDSAQITRYIPQKNSEGKKPVIVDMGSGAGFPGLLIALLTKAEVHLVEADSRKCTFLREANRIMETGATIHTNRLESAAHHLGPVADIVTARALASLDKLLNLGIPFLKKDGFCLFLKGEKAQDELIDSAKNWKMVSSTLSSLSDKTGVILKLEEISRRHD